MLISCLLMYSTSIDYLDALIKNLLIIVSDSLGTYNNHQLNNLSIIYCPKIKV